MHNKLKSAWTFSRKFSPPAFMHPAWVLSFPMICYFSDYWEISLNSLMDNFSLLLRILALFTATALSKTWNSFTLLSPCLGYPLYLLLNHLYFYTWWPWSRFYLSALSSHLWKTVCLFPLGCLSNPINVWWSCVLSKLVQFLFSLKKWINRFNYRENYGWWIQEL